MGNDVSSQPQQTSKKPQKTAEPKENKRGSQKISSETVKTEAKQPEPEKKEPKKTIVENTPKSPSNNTPKKVTISSKISDPMLDLSEKEKEMMKEILIPNKKITPYRSQSVKQRGSRGNIINSDLFLEISKPTAAQIFSDSFYQLSPSRDDQIHQMKEEIESKDKAIHDLTEKIFQIKEYLKVLTSQKNNQIRELQAQVDNAEREKDRLLENYESREQTLSESVLKLKTRLIDLQELNLKKEEETQYWQQQFLMLQHIMYGKNPSLKEQIEQESEDGTEEEEIPKTPIGVLALVKTKDEKIGELQNEIFELREHNQELYEHNKELSEELEESYHIYDNLKSEYFFALAIGMKLNLTQRGTDCNIDVQSLWEECQQEEIKVEVWRKWIQKKLIQSLVLAEEGKVMERLQKLDEKLGHSPCSSKGTLEEPPLNGIDSIGDFIPK